MLKKRIFDGLITHAFKERNCFMQLNSISKGFCKKNVHCSFLKKFPQLQQNFQKEIFKSAAVVLLAISNCINITSLPPQRSISAAARLYLTKIVKNAGFLWPAAAAELNI